MPGGCDDVLALGSSDADQPFSSVLALLRNEVAGAHHCQELLPSTGRFPAESRHGVTLSWPLFGMLPLALREGP